MGPRAMPNIVSSRCLESDYDYWYVDPYPRRYADCIVWVNQERDHGKSPMSRHCTFKRNLEARYRCHCCREKVISITYSDCMYVAVVIMHAKDMLLIICKHCGSTTLFLHYLTNVAIVKKCDLAQNV
jgi:hypothetical protein